MSARTLRARVLMAIAVWIVSAAMALGEALAPPHRDAFRRAHQRLSQALAAEGADCYRSLERLSVTLEGTLSNPRQSYSLRGAPTPDAEEVSLGHWFFDFVGERSRTYERSLYHGGHDLRFESLVLGNTTYDIVTQMRRYNARPSAFDRRAPELLHLPGFVLAGAMDSPGSASWIGPSTLDEAPVEIVELDWGSSRRRLYIEDESSRVLGISWLSNDLLEGERETMLRFEGRSETGGCQVPQRVQRWVNGRVWAERSITRVELDGPIPDKVFELEHDLEAFPTLPADGSLPVRAIRGRVRELFGLGGQLYRVPFVELEESVVVFDAVLSAATAERVLEAIAAETGGKPIGHVVLSHHHTDHLRGLRPFVESGATVVTSPASRPMAERLLGAPPSRLAAGSSREPTAVEARFLLVDPGASIELPTAQGEVRVVSLGPTPHVDDLLLVVVEPERVVLQADSFFTFSSFGSQFDLLVRWLEASGLEEPLVTGVHHGPVGLDYLRERQGAGREGHSPAYLDLLGLPGK